jgi:hypothetical protein
VDTTLGKEKLPLDKQTLQKERPAAAEKPRRDVEIQGPAKEKPEPARPPTKKE